jgi:cell division protein ZapA (FtsZ GTPase activity inhibitor)
MSDPKSGSVQVRIYDREYAIRTTGDPDRLHRLCVLLDRRMREIADDSGAADTVKVAILTALSLADDLLRAHEELQGIDKAVARRSAECASILDGCL